MAVPSPWREGQTPSLAGAGEGGRRPDEGYAVKTNPAVREVVNTNPTGLVVLRESGGDKDSAPHMRSTGGGGRCKHSSATRKRYRCAMEETKDGTTSHRRHFRFEYLIAKLSLPARLALKVATEQAAPLAKHQKLNLKRKSEPGLRLEVDTFLSAHFGRDQGDSRGSHESVRLGRPCCYRSYFFLFA